MKKNIIMKIFKKQKNIDINMVRAYRVINEIEEFLDKSIIDGTMVKNKDKILKMFHRIEDFIFYYNIGFINFPNKIKAEYILKRAWIVFDKYKEEINILEILI